MCIGSTCLGSTAGNEPVREVFLTLCLGVCGKVQVSEPTVESDGKHRDNARG